jgi:hypothetical protein
MSFSIRSLVLVAMLCAVACSGSNASVHESPPVQDEVADRGCRAAVSLARACYDRATPRANCDGFVDVVEDYVARNGGGAGVQKAIGEICQAACQARQEGYEFARVRGTIREAVCVASR